MAQDIPCPAQPLGSALRWWLLMRPGPWKALFLTLPENSFCFPFRQSTKPEIPAAGRCVMALADHGDPIKRSRPALGEGTSERNQGFTLPETMGHDSFIVSPHEEGGKPPPSCVGAVLKGEKRPARRMTHCHRHLLRQRQASSEKNRRQSFPFRLLLCLRGERKKKTNPHSHSQIPIPAAIKDARCSPDSAVMG